METALHDLAFSLVMIIEAFALLIIVVGLIIAPVRALAIRFRHGGWLGSFDDVRKSIGRTLLLGLEFLLAAEIVRSIMVGETLEAVLVLGLIVFIRTFLSISIEMEINGRWPWQGHIAKQPQPFSNDAAKQPDVTT